jgi:large subunit ribosomal protein L25
MFVINAKARDIKESLEKMRKAGELPAVFYGAGKKSTSVTINTIEFKKVWHKAGESSAIVVKTPTGDVDVLIHEVQVDPVKDEPIHVDFLAIDMSKKIKVKVPVEFVGIAGAVKNGLGNLVKVVHEIEIEALPKDLPHNLEADISKLETVADSLLVSDIKIPTGVTLITPDTEVVASIVAQKEEKEEEAAPIDLTAIEVEKKGKKEEEGAEGGAPEAGVKEEKK